jgi:hypothetical protein
MIDQLAAELAANAGGPSSAAPSMLAEVGGEIDPTNLTAAASSAPAAGAPQSAPGFDPAIHEADAAGNPVFRADGVTFKLKRGRGAAKAAKPVRILATAPPPAFAPAGSEPQQPFAAGAAADDAQKRADAARCAKETAETVFDVLVSFVGPDWEPEPAERTRLEAALERCYMRYGTLDLPPGLALVLAFGMYAAKRPITAFAIARLMGKEIDPEELTKGLSEPGVIRNAA